MRNIQVSGNLYGKHVTLKQIQKRTAKKLFCAGEEIYLQSSNMMPINVWQSVYPVHYEEHLSTPEIEFETRVNGFLFYNCDNERGKYIHFYKKIS